MHIGTGEQTKHCERGRRGKGGCVAGPRTRNVRGELAGNPHFVTASASRSGDTLSVSFKEAGLRGHAVGDGDVPAGNVLAAKLEFSE